MSAAKPTPLTDVNVVDISACASSDFNLVAMLQSGATVHTLRAGEVSFAVALLALTVQTKYFEPLTWSESVPGRTADTSFIAGSAAIVALAFAVALAAMPVARDAGSAGFSPQLQRGAVRDLKAGRLLVASRNLPDPNFATTVILLAEYGKDGAMGLIVNRRTDVTLARIFPDLQSPESGATAFFGGPVSVSSVLALLRSTSARADSRHVVGDVYLVNTGEVLKKTMAAGEGPRRFRVYVGYSGWGPGQLEHETNDGSWFVLDGDADVVFDPDPESIWRRQIKRAEALSASARPAPIHASHDALLVETGGVSGRGAPRSP